MAPPAVNADPLQRLPDAYIFAPTLVTLAPAPTPTSDAVHRLASEVATRHLRLGRRGVAICGAASQTGVTLAAANLAVALSQSGVSTLLIDANLREPGLERLISPPAAPSGLLQIVRDGASRSEVLHREVLPNLDLLYAGGVTENAGRLVAGQRLRDLLGRSMRDYDCMIVDTPPSNRCAETLAIAGAVGYAIIVGKRNASFIDDIRVLSGELAKDGVTVVGSIFNSG